MGETAVAPPSGANGQRWLVFIYQAPSAPAGPRASVWRTLKRLGALWLQQSVAVFPERAELREALNLLGERVDGWGGEAMLLTTSSSNPDWDARLIERFTAAANADYAALVAAVAQFEDEIRRRQDDVGGFRWKALNAGGRTLTARLERITRRDFFGASGRTAATDALTRGRAALQAESDHDNPVKGKG